MHASTIFKDVIGWHVLQAAESENVGAGKDDSASHRQESLREEKATRLVAIMPV